MWNAECGIDMEARSLIDLPLPFRIPHSAFRIRAIPQSERPPPSNPRPTDSWVSGDVKGRERDVVRYVVPVAAVEEEERDREQERALACQEARARAAVVAQRALVVLLGKRAGVAPVGTDRAGRGVRAAPRAERIPRVRRARVLVRPHPRQRDGTRGREP